MALEAATPIGEFQGEHQVSWTGQYVSMAGTTLAIGHNGNDSVDANGGNVSPSGNHGKVTVHQYDSGTWTDMDPSNSVNLDDGSKVPSMITTTNGNLRLAVGAPFSEKVRLFEYASGAWSLESIFNPGSYTGDFGAAVSLFGDWIAIASPEYGGAPYFPGAVTMCQLSATGGFTGVEQTLTSDLSPAYKFGQCLSLGQASDGTYRLAVGEPGYDRVWVYEYTGGTWSLKGSAITGAGTYTFGESISLDGDRIAIGDPTRRRTSDNLVAGCVTIYEWNGTDWHSPYDIIFGDRSHFGSSVSLKGDRLAIGVKGGRGYGVAQGTYDSGHAVIYQFSASAWTPVTAMDGVNAGENATITHQYSNSTPVREQFGTSIALSGDMVAVGAPKFNPDGTSSTNTTYSMYRGRVQAFQLPAAGSSGPDLTGFQAAATAAVEDLAAITDATTANDKSQAALAAVADDAAFTGKTAAEKRTLVRQVMAQAVTRAATASVDTFEVSTATFASFFADLDGDAKTALDSAPKVAVVAPDSTTIVTADAAVYCPLQNGETVTMQFDGASVTWSMADDLLTPSVTAGTLSTGNTTSIASGSTTTLTSDSGSVFHFFAGSVGGAADSSGGGSGDPFLRPILA